MYEIYHDGQEMRTQLVDRRPSSLGRFKGYGRVDESLPPGIARVSDGRSGYFMFPLDCGPTDYVDYFVDESRIHLRVNGVSVSSILHYDRVPPLGTVLAYRPPVLDHRRTPKTVMATPYGGAMSCECGACMMSIRLEDREVVHCVNENCRHHGLMLDLPKIPMHEADRKPELLAIASRQAAQAERAANNATGDWERDIHQGSLSQLRILR